LLDELELAEQHYFANRWDDSISNSRRLLEAVMQEVAAKNTRLARGRFGG
jgi:hypothetical protein